MPDGAKLFLRILVVEDNPDDAEMCMRELRRGGIEPEWKRVETEEDYRASLNADLDLVIADYTLPQFSGPRALEVLKESGLAVPLIVVTGSIGEERAVAVMRLGAHDYFLKDRLTRLPEAVRQIIMQSRVARERGEAEEILRKGAERFRQVVENIDEVFWMTEPEKEQMVYISPGYERVWGRSTASLHENPRLWTEVVHPEDKERVAAAALKQASGEYDIEYRIVRPDGTVRWIHDRAFPVRDAKGRIYRIAGVAADITARHAAEEQLRLQSSALAAAANSILITDLTGRIEWVNAAFSRVTGYSAEEALGKKPGELLKSGEHEETFYSTLWETILAGEVWHHEIVNRTKDGNHIHQEMTVTPVKDQAGRITHFIAVNQDVTNRKSLEESLRQAQKMEAIGRLSGGIAHDFNNILTVILGNVAILETEELTKDIADSVKEIQKAGERAANLTRQLLLFARRQPMQMAVVDINRSVELTVKMIGRILGEDIQLTFRPGAQNLSIRADAGMLDQVLMNLAVNARDAMPKGGRLTIETERRELDAESAEAVAAKPGLYVVLSVSDTGTGIPADIMPKIFDPFFSTKDVGKGTGLGLATVFGIVQQHGGYVRVYSEPGHGATFRVYFPEVADPLDQARPAAPPPAVPGGSETLLIVEDETAISDIISRYLKRLGYDVLTAGTGSDALKVWDEHNGRIDLVITDIVMPGGMDGIELSGHLIERNPEIPVIFSSGYSDLIAAGDFPLKEGENFLTKPYALPKVGQLVRTRLNANR